MQFGVLQAFQNFRDKYDDADIYAQALEMSDLYEPLGFDFILCAEHHFHGYTMSPNPFDYLCYMAGRTKHIKLGTGVVIVPWNDPYRAASHFVALDHLSKGRALMGVGRGLANIEMETFGIDMSDTRAMYDEGARKIVETLTTGVYPGGGRFYPQYKRTEIRPRPYSLDWSQRMLCVGMTPPSAIEAGKIGGRLMSFVSMPWEIYKDSHLAPYKAAFEETHNRPAPALVLGDCVFVHEDEERARELAHLYLGNYGESVTEFYNVTGEHMKTAKGYEHYLEAAEVARNTSREAAREGFVNLQLWGTPKQVVEKLRVRREVLDHPFDVAGLFGLSDMPLEEQKQVITLFAEEVLPIVRDWN